MRHIFIRLIATAAIVTAALELGACARNEAAERAELRPRVSGCISSVNFIDGNEVRKGDVLFVIDPRPYAAERDKARAQLAQARSQLALAKSERERATKLLGQHAISQEEFDTRNAGSEQAQANVEAPQASAMAAHIAAPATRAVSSISWTCWMPSGLSWRTRTAWPSGAPMRRPA